MMFSRRIIVLSVAVAIAGGGAWAHDAHGRSNAPPEARRLKNPLPTTDYDESAIRVTYALECGACHGLDGKATTPLAGRLPVRPTNLANYLMESMRDGEIYWVVTHGIETRMPAFDGKLSEVQRWQLVLYVRALRSKQKAIEWAKLGPYEWSLPPGFPFPDVPAANPMTKEKVELGRYLFHDRRLSLNRTQSCATCHQQARAFADNRPRGLGSTGELHPRGPMSLVNSAYNTTLTWANPNVRDLETQALVPMFGEAPVELGMTGKEDLLLKRLRAAPPYGKLFAAAFPGERDPFTIGNVTKAIASFERTILSGDSPYDRYHRGDDPNAISESAKRGETLFFSERLECFHCHGGFNFTGSTNYLDKGFAEAEFHNTGLYNLRGDLSYPKENTGLYEFTHQPDDVGKFKAPTLRNIAVSAPYMHDGSVKTMEEAIEHYRVGGRTLKTGALAGAGAENPNKSEFIKAFDLSRQEKADLMAFLQSLTDETVLHNAQFSDPWAPSQLITRRASPAPTKYILRGEVVRVYLEDGAISLHHDEVPGFMVAMNKPMAMEFLVTDKSALASLKPGMKITAGVRKQGRDYVLDQIRRTQ
jgi:cytochrome c peroxidase